LPTSAGVAAAVSVNDSSIFGLIAYPIQCVSVVSLFITDTRLPHDKRRQRTV